MSGREWWTCEAGHEWTDENDEDECPVCEKEAKQQREAALASPHKVGG